MKRFERDQYRYTEYFCEENIWWLARSLIDEGYHEQQMEVLVLSNDNKSILLLNQRAAQPGQITLWDYHVLLKLTAEQQNWIFDFDSLLHFPEPGEIYWRKSFPPQDRLAPRYRSLVRIIPVGDYLQYFHSDRSHMQGRIPASAFPDYPIIQPAAGERRIDIADYWDMNKVLANCEIRSVESLSRQA